MPFTPFHFGPAATIHALAPRHVSFLAFCTANVLIDIEPLYFLLSGQYPLHRVFHTYLGSTLVVLATALIFLLLLWLANRVNLNNVGNWRSLRPVAVWGGAIVGTYSHVFLDSIMHADIVPLAPFSQENVLYQLISIESLHVLCVAFALIGVFILHRRNSIARSLRRSPWMN